MSIADQMLARGCVKHVGALHGETIQVLEGPDEGKTFQANIRETQPDQILSTDLGEDARPVVMLRFDDSLPVPNITSATKIKTLSDGKIWTATKEDFSAFLTTDFKLIEWTAQDS